jgi:hypothetical protein
MAATPSYRSTTPIIGDLRFQHKSWSTFRRSCSGARLSRIASATATTIAVTKFKDVCCRLSTDWNRRVVLAFYSPESKAIKASFFVELKEVLECIAAKAKLIIVVWRRQHSPGPITSLFDQYFQLSQIRGPCC